MSASDVLYTALVSEPDSFISFFNIYNFLLNMTVKVLLVKSGVNSFLHFLN